MTHSLGHAAAPERRRRRSDDTITALHYQLSLTRNEAELEAIVLVDDRGCLIAGAGAWPACEELAAYAPLLVNRAAAVSATVSARVSELSSDALVHMLSIHGGQAVLCGVGGTTARGASIARAAAGCTRILVPEKSA